MRPVMDYFQALLNSLAPLLGSVYVADVITVFFAVLGGDQLARALSEAPVGDMRSAAVVSRCARPPWY